MFPPLHVSRVINTTHFNQNHHRFKAFSKYEIEATSSSDLDRIVDSFKFRKTYGTFECSRGETRSAIVLAENVEGTTRWRTPRRLIANRRRGISFVQR